MTASTPGPWVQRAGHPCDVEAPDTGHVATCETAEDARLIAAAPELRAALQCALFDLEQTYCHVSSVSADRIKNDTIPLARAAIAKATTPSPASAERTDGQ